MNSRDDERQSNIARCQAAGSAVRIARIAISRQPLDSRELFTGTREIIIAHGEDTYRLRLTAQNKLILTK